MVGGLMEGYDAEALMRKRRLLGLVLCLLCSAVSLLVVSATMLLMLSRADADDAASQLKVVLHIA